MTSHNLTTCLLSITNLTSQSSSWLENTGEGSWGNGLSNEDFLTGKGSWGFLLGLVGWDPYPLPHSSPSLLPMVSKISFEREEQRLHGEIRDGNPHSWGSGTAATKHTSPQFRLSHLPRNREPLEHTIHRLGVQRTGLAGKRGGGNGHWIYSEQMWKSCQERKRGSKEEDLEWGP